MFSRSNIFKIAAIVALLGLLLLPAIGCQQNQSKEAGGTATVNQSSQPTASGGAKVLFFSAEY